MAHEIEGKVAGAIRAFKWNLTRRRRLLLHFDDCVLLAERERERRS